jgi:excisionase family DNA binding protein
MEHYKITQVHGVGSEELKQDFKYIVREGFKEFALNFQPVIPPEYLTRQEVARILKVSLVTLSDWNKKKILNPYRLGNLIRYKRSEIEQALICINPKKV